MLRHPGWTEAADAGIKRMTGAIAAKTVTYDFERLIRPEGCQATLLKSVESWDLFVEHVG